MPSKLLATFLASCPSLSTLCLAHVSSTVLARLPPLPSLYDLRLFRPRHFDADVADHVGNCTPGVRKLKLVGSFGTTPKRAHLTDTCLYSTTGGGPPQLQRSDAPIYKRKQQMAAQQASDAASTGGTQSTISS